LADLQIPKAFKPLFSPKRYKVYYGGRGGAKSHNIARALLIQGMQRKMLICCAREIQKSIKDSVHRLLSDLITEYGLQDFYRVLETEIRGKNGTEFIFRGLKHNTTDLKSLEGTDVLWIEEAENVSKRSYEIIIPTIRKDNSEIWISFNPKNRSDPTYTQFVKGADEDTFVKKVSWRDNPFFPEVLNKERLKLEANDPEAYEHIWEGGFDTRKSGAVYAKQLDKARAEGRICKVPYDPAFEVFTAHDLGFGDAYAIWWLQFVGRELRWLEYYENSGEQMDFYARLIKSKPYNYMKDGHFLPHDGGHGNIRGLKPTVQFADMGIETTLLPREQDINPGIELLRQTIHFSAFDADKCADGLQALENYAYEWDEERSVFKSKPKHDWASHGASAARYAALAAAEIKGNITETKPQGDPYAHRQAASSWMG